MEASVISQKIIQIIADVLGHRVDEISTDSILMEDLGAESLDYLDIVFRLEDEFGIKIPRGDIEKSARGSLTDEEFAPGGVVSAAGLERLQELIPEAKDRIKPGLRSAAILSLFTVETFTKITLRKVQEKESK